MEGIVDEGVVCSPLLAVDQCFEGGGLRHHIGHVHNRGHTTRGRRMGLGGEVAFVGQAWLTGVDVVVDDAWEEELKVES